MKTWRKPLTVRTRALFASTSAIALLASGVLSPAFAIDIAARLSPAGLAQNSGGAGSGSAAAAGAGAALVSAQAQAQIALSAANLAKAAQAIKDATAAQVAARASNQLTLNGQRLDATLQSLASKLTASAWNGSVLSGLKPVDDTDSTLWVNADPLKKDASTATATVKQTAANALLNWQSFDLDKGETIVFDQQDHTEWTVLNRIVAGPRDPVTGSRFVASPSVVLGKIQAPGSVYIINPNGIIFGPNSQINVHSLIASSLDVGSPTMTQGERDSFFLNAGILGTGNNVPAASFSYDQRDAAVQGKIDVEPGAIINANLAPRSLSPDSGGFVYLFAPDVENGGTITTPAGETMMVSAQQVQLIPNRYPDGGVAADLTVDASQTFRAVGVNSVSGSTNVTPPDVWRLDGPISGQIVQPGSVVNHGVINAERGVVILNGDNVTNGPGDEPGGIIQANTSITRNGQVFLDARVNLNLSGEIQILPAENGETIPASAIANFHPASLEMQGNVIDLQSGALVIAPGGSVSAKGSGVEGRLYPDQARPVSETPRIYMAADSQIDVAGLGSVTLPMSANLISFKPFGNEFADQPLQRQGALRGQELTIDIRETGNLDGVDWVGTPLADASGFVKNIQRGIDQLLTTGGTVSFAATSGDVVLREGSSVNVAGGYIQYEGGTVNTTKLLTADGHIVDIARADPMQTYLGVAGVSTDSHEKWGISTIFVNPLVSGGIFEPGYIEGHDAGGITLNAANYAIEGTLNAGVTAGDKQRAAGLRPALATANSLNTDPLAMPSAGFLTISGANNLIIASHVNALADNFTVADALPADRVANTQLSASQLSQAQFSRISASFSGHVEVTADAALTVTPGGAITLVGGSADIEGHLTAPSGSISIESTGHIAGDLPGVITAYKPLSPDRPDIFDLTIGAGAVLDTSGLWVNDADAAPADVVGGAYIDGGLVSLKTDARSAECRAAACSVPGLGANVRPTVDLTGAIVLADGSRIDVSSGGRVAITGLIQLDSKGREAGNGGSVALQTYVGGFSAASGPPPPTTGPLSAGIVLTGSDGSADQNAQALNQEISAYGFAQGGTLTIQTLSVHIGETAPDALNLPADFFTGNAFSSYNFTAVSGGISVAPGAVLTLNQMNLIANNAILALPTGFKVSELAGKAYLPDILRAPVNLNLTANLPPLPLAPYNPALDATPAQVAIRIGEDAVIEGDPGAAIGLSVKGREAFTPSDQSIFGSPIAQQIAVAEVLGAIEAPGGSITFTGGKNSEIWLGAASRLDVSGKIVLDARQTLLRTGEVLPGGTVSVNAADVNVSVVVLSGAVIDVSGTSGEFDIFQQSAFGQQITAIPVWSDAGAINFLASSLLFDGTLVAQVGAASANGGHLTIAVPPTSVPQAGVITVRQDGDTVPADLTPTDSLGSLSGSLFFRADSLAHSGITDVTLSASPIQGDALTGSQGKFAPGTILFDGNVDIGGLNNLFLDASTIALTNVAPPVNADGCNVCLDAGYVLMRGAGTFSRTFPVAGNGVLRIHGDLIDIAAGGSGSGVGGMLSFSGVADANIVSTGDIRLRVPLANVPLDLAPGTLPGGELITAGDLTLQA
ncbi:MAG TPA: filamentous hemagglutinin N-terminal domain-containing protein, partial [Micropepsaceae bacterium]|nr:filamentous hemagglutinin N-terminal domain-containing protein [Micropepsaceae bacterium]